MAKAVNHNYRLHFYGLESDIFDFLFIFRFQTADFPLFFAKPYPDGVVLRLPYFCFRTRLFNSRGIVLSRQQQGFAPYRVSSLSMTACCFITLDLGLMVRTRLPVPISAMMAIGCQLFASSFTEIHSRPPDVSR